MPAEEVARLRNVAIVGQGGAGKTTVADALLFAAGASTRLGRVDDGSSAFDIEPEEVRRKSSIAGGLHHAPWRKHELNLIDTPGYSAFLHDTHNCLRAATGAVLVLGPTGGEAVPAVVQEGRVAGRVDQVDLGLLPDAVVQAGRDGAPAALLLGLDVEARRPVLGAPDPGRGAGGEQ